MHSARIGGEWLNKKTFAKVLSVLLMVSLCSFVAYSYGLGTNNSAAVDNGYQHKDPSVSYNVYVFKDGVQVAESGNTITNIGEQWIQSWAGLSGEGNTTSRNATQYISLSNDGSAAAAWTVLPGEVNANGFSRALGDVTGWINSGDYAYNVTKTFTGTGTQQLQTAGLNWAGVAGSDNNLFACADFTQTTFNAGDTLTITWVITVNAN